MDCSSKDLFFNCLWFLLRTHPKKEGHGHQLKVSLSSNRLTIKKFFGTIRVNTSNKIWRTLGSCLMNLSLAYGIWLILSKSPNLSTILPSHPPIPPAPCPPTRTILSPYLPTPLGSYPFIILLSYHLTLQRFGIDTSAIIEPEEFNKVHG